jgi:hypothetical protein
MEPFSREITSKLAERAKVSVVRKARALVMAKLKCMITVELDVEVLYCGCVGSSTR